MKTSYATASAILGLAFGGVATNVLAEDGAAVARNTVDAVNNVVTTRSEAQLNATSNEYDVSASGQAVTTAALTTGNTNTATISETISTIHASNADTPLANELGSIATASVENPAAAAQALEQLTPEQSNAQQTVAVQQTTVNLQLVSTHLMQQQQTTTTQRHTFSPTLMAALLQNRTGGGASADAQFGNVSTFFNLKRTDNTQHSNDYTSGYETKDWHVSAGVDYRWRPNFITGVIANFMQSSTEYNQSKGNMDTKGWGLGIYGAYYWDNGGFVEGITGYNRNRYDLDRKIAYTISTNDQVRQVNQWARSEPDGEVLYASVTGGYTFDRQAFTVTPKLSLNYLQNDVSAYQEQMSNPLAAGGSLALSYTAQTYTSFTSKLGVTAAKALSTRHGVFIPQVSIDWVHEFDNDQQQLMMRFTQDRSNTALSILTTPPDRNYFDLGIGLAGQFANGRSGFITLNKLLGYDDVDNYTLTGGFRLEF